MCAFLHTRQPRSLIKTSCTWPMGARLSSSRKTRASLPSSSEPLPQSSRPQSISGAVLPQPQPLYTSPPASPLERNPQDASNFHLYSHDQLPSKSATLPPYSAPDMISMPAPHDSKSSTVPSSSTSPPQVPLYIRSPPPPRRLDTALSIVKECLSAVKEASDMFLPLKAALVGFVKVWEVYEVRCAPSRLVSSLLQELMRIHGAAYNRCSR